MKESIQKASQTSALLLSDVKDCYRKASPLEEIVVRQLLQQTVELEKRIQDFAGAVDAEKP